jgi:hypothetical protein
MKVLETQMGFKFTGAHQILVYANDVILFRGKIGTIKTNTQVLIGISKKVGLEINTEKTNYMSISRHQSAGKHHIKKTANR